LSKEPAERGECGCLTVAARLKEGTLRVQATKSSSSFEVTTDATGVVGHAGVALLGELADRLGLTRALGWYWTRRAAGAVMWTRPCCGTWR
jgi:hypothetical protein